MPRGMLLATLALLLTGCAERLPVSEAPTPVCPTVVKWTADDKLALAAEEAVDAPMLKRAAVEYWAMRDALKALGCS